MDTQHTPGPWAWKRRVGDNGETIAYLLETEHRPIRLNDPVIMAAREDWIGALDRGDNANARLIAAAPALLAALKAAKNVLQSYHEQCVWTDEACNDGGIDLDQGHGAITDALAAIAKAEAND